MPRGRNAGKGALVQRGGGQSFKTLREVRAGVKKGYRGPREERGGSGMEGDRREAQRTRRTNGNLQLLGVVGGVNLSFVFSLYSYFYFYPMNYCFFLQQFASFSCFIYGISWFCLVV